MAAAFVLLATAALPLGEGGRSPEPIALPDVPATAHAGPQPRTQQIVQEVDVEDEAEASLDTLEVAETPAGAEEPSTSAEATDDPRVVARQESTETADFGLIGVTWDNGTAPEDLLVQVRTRTEGSWTTWTDLEVSDIVPAEGAGSRTGTEPMWVGQSDGVGVRLLSASHAPDGVEVVLVDGGSGLAQPTFVLVSETDTSTSTTTQTTDTATVGTTATPGVAPKPAIVTRRQWGVNRTWEVSCSSPTRASSARGISLHHTAGQNGYSRSEAPGIVRGTHLYHTRSLGWCDIGYNFLVDAYGTIYEGRRGGIENQVRGSHAGNWDANLYLTGISMMGNYDTVDVPQALRTAVINLSAWRLSFFGRDAVGKITIGGGRLDSISGHRDIYSAGIRPATATACPGRYGYAWLNGGMRNQVQARIDAAATQPTAEESPPPVEDQARSILGQTARPDGKSVGNVEVAAVDAVTGQRVASTVSSSSGYSLDVPSGEYVVEFKDVSDRFADSDYPTSPVVVDASDVTLDPVRLIRRAPDATVAPAVAGRPHPGATLTLTPGTWVKPPQTVRQTWTRSGVPIIGAHGTTYRVRAADVGETISTEISLGWGWNYETLVTAPLVAKSVVRAPSVTRARLVAPRIPAGNRGRVAIRVRAADNPRPIGTLVVKRAGRTITTRTLRRHRLGAMTVRLPKLAPGRHRIRVVYRGSHVTARSKSTPVVLRVRRR